MTGYFAGICRRSPGWLLWGAMLCAAASAEPGQIDYPAADPQPGFADVLALPAGSPAAVYPYAEAPQQFAELWLPRGGGAAPLVIFIHGGCWLNEFSIDYSHAAATALTQLGFAVWNIEYRRVGDVGGGWPGSFDDVLAALALLDELDPDGVDLDRTALAGHSAGGHLALLAAAAVRVGPGYAFNLRAVFGLAPIVDIVEYARGEGSCNAATTRFMGGMPEDIPSLYTAANPAEHPSPPGTAILMGVEDRIVPAVRPPRDVWLSMQVAGAGHFDWVYPGTTAWQRLVEQLQRTLM